MTIQEIVDTYHLGKDYKEMSKQIDEYGPSDFWYELREDFEACQTHTEDWAFFTNMAYEYACIKEDQREREQEALLLAYSKWTINLIEFVLADEDQLKINIDSYMDYKRSCL